MAAFGGRLEQRDGFVLAYLEGEPYQLGLQHGTLLRVSKDGAKTDILATGFRAPNGVCVNPDNTFFLTDQEGHWTPKNRINWVRPGRFYGNFWGYHDITDRSDAAMQQPDLDTLHGDLRFQELVKASSSGRGSKR